jgi:hypothetical protein
MNPIIGYSNEDHKPGCQPEVEHDFIVELHVKIDLVKDN